MDVQTRRHELLLQHQSARNSFHAVLNSFSEKELRGQSLNPGWTNGEILAHMTFGFIIINVLIPLARVWGQLPKSSSKWFAWLLNRSTRPFHWINRIGARGQGLVFTRSRIGKIFDWACFSLVQKIDSIRDDEWEHGMYYPTLWDANFDEFMTLEKLFYYPVTHLNFHLKQISR